ncbi:S-layer homology domain-containing protein [Paenibacillus tritici]|uniref:S-layer homology domain-containing protein n=1 Tax=Paenibacillus tritici TaxID=1873425 RepID=UPI001BA585F6|nr:S-layer homology domain-containing protein [Paenibacillus tritici]QUL54540.1 S-layer homology domain-containing protein [Paenibacillus tritici]
MKKLWRGLTAGVLGISMLLGSLGSVSAAPAPKDIQGHWAQKQLQSWLDKGYLGGYPDGTVKPNKAITRGEYVALINRLFGFTDTASISFTDVKKSNWVYSEVSKAVKAGYIGGYENNTFRANNPLTRQEAAVIAAKVLKLSTSSTPLKFKDNAQISAWAKAAVASAAGKKIINGYPDGTFGPKKSLTRAEAVGIISNSVMHKPGTGGGVTPMPTPTTTPAPTATPVPTTSPTATPVPGGSGGGGTGGGGGGGGGGSVTLPSVSNVTYGHVGSVTADVYVTPSVTGAVYYVVAPYSMNVTAPTAAQVKDGMAAAGTTVVHSGKTAVTANTTVAFSVYGLSAGTEYTVYVALADNSGNWSGVTPLRLKTAAGTATSLTQVGVTSIGTVSAEVYAAYGQMAAPVTPLKYVVVKATEADPTALQIANGQNSAGAQLTGTWAGSTSTLAPMAKHSFMLNGLSADTAYKVFFVSGTGGSLSPVEILRIHTAK